MEPGGRYRDVFVDKRLAGSMKADGSSEAESRAGATAKSAAVSRGRSRETGERGSTRTRGAVSNGHEEELDNVSDDRSTAAKRRVEREKRRQALAENGRGSDGMSSRDMEGTPLNVLQGRVSTGKLVADYLRQTPFRTVLGVGAVAGAATGAITAARLARRQKDVITGEVKIDLLKKIELLTIRLRLDRASEERPPV